MKQEAGFGQIDIVAKDKFQELAESIVPAKSTAGSPGKLVNGISL